MKKLTKMMKFLEKSNNEYFIGFILLIILLCNSYPSWLIGGDVEAIFLYPDIFFQKSLYLWSESNSFGAFLTSTGNIIVYGLFYLLSFILPPYFLNILIYIIGYCGSYFAITHLLRVLNVYYLGNSKQIRFFIPLVSLFYVINLQFNQLFFRGIFTEVFFFVLLPLGILVYIHFLNGKNIYLLFLPLLLQLWGNPGHLLIFIIAVFIFYIFHVLNKQCRWLDLVKTLGIGLLYILLSLFIFLPLLLFLIGGGGDIAGEELIKNQTIIAEFNQQLTYHSLLNLFQNLNHGYFNVIFNFIGIKYIIHLFIFITILISFLIFFRKKKNFIYFFVIYLLLVAILQGAAGFFSDYYIYFVEHVPGGAMIRSLHSKFNYLLLLVEVILLLLIVGRVELKKGLFVSVLVLVPGIPFIFNLFDPTYLKVDISNRYLQSIQEFNTVARNENIRSAVILPYTNLQWQTFTNWGYWGYSLFQQSTNSIHFHTAGTIGINSYNKKFLKHLNNNNVLNIQYLQEKNIDSIIVQKDFNYHYTDYYSFRDNTEEIIDFLNMNTSNLEKVYTSEYFDVYKIISSKFIDLYGTQILYKKNNSTSYAVNINSTIVGKIGFASYNPNWKLYLEPYEPLQCDTGASVYSGTTMRYQIGTGTYIVQSMDTFEKISDSITGSTLSGILDLNPDVRDEDLKIGDAIVVPVFSTPEPYHVTECPSENTFYAGGELSKLWQKPIFEDTHTMVYDYANQWTIDPEYIKANYPKEYYHENPDGSIDVRMTLYFKPQSYFYLGLIISGTTLVLLLGYLGYDTVRRRKNKNILE